MDKQIYHGEITHVCPSRQTSLAVDSLSTMLTDGFRYVVRLSFEADTDLWDPTAVADLTPANARSLAWHLLNAADVAEQTKTERDAEIVGAHRLPTIILCGIEFFIDERLRQLRRVGNPHQFFDLDGPVKR